MMMSAHIFVGSGFLFSRSLLGDATWGILFRREKRYSKNRRVAFQGSVITWSAPTNDDDSDFVGKFFGYARSRPTLRGKFHVTILFYLTGAEIGTSFFTAMGKMRYPEEFQYVQL